MALTPLENPDGVFCTPSSDAIPNTSNSFLTGLIGYSCSYIPVELLSLTGFKPYRLIHGDITLSNVGENFVRVDACPLIKSNIGYVMQNRTNFTALIGSTGCDMARRMFEVLAEMTDIPAYVFNNPRTDNLQMFNNEIDQLIQYLNKFTGTTFSNELIKNEIEHWESAREKLRSLKKKRQATPSLVSTTTLHKAVINYYQGNIEQIKIDINEESSYKPRVFLIGSPVPYEASQILELIENRLRIVGDFNCGISRFLNIKIKEKTLDGIKEAYYNQPDCIFKRPNRKFYEWVNNQIKEVNCTGIIAWILDYCDNYDFELKRMEKTLHLPILKLKSDFSYQNFSQLKTRIDAFIEMLSHTRSSIL